MSVTDDTVSCIHFLPILLSLLLNYDNVGYEMMQICHFSLSYLVKAMSTKYTQFDTN